MSRTKGDVELFRRALWDVERVQAARVPAARAQFRKAMDTGPVEGPSPELRRVTLHLDEGQVDAAKQLAVVRRGAYQEHVRRWVTASLVAARERMRAERF